jgi:hypothetical protein
MTADHVPEERSDDERPATDRPAPDEPADERSAERARPETSDAEVDRLFAELVADWGRTATAGDRVRPSDAGRPEPAQLPQELPPAEGPQPISWPTRGPDDWAANHPLPARPGSPSPEAPVPPAPPAADHPPAPASTWRTPTSGRSGTDDEAYERYRPELHPIGRPRWPIVAGWAAMTFAVVATLLAIFGVPLPPWVGWLAVGGFLGGFGLLVAQLPRHRPPDAGDGAVL